MEKISKDPYYINSKKDLCFNYHPGQERVMGSMARFILLLAGTQSGKSVLGAWWLFREMILCGPGDYLIAAPTFPLMNKKVIPEVKKLFKTKLRLGEYKAADRIFEISERGDKVLFGQVQEERTKIYIGHAQDSDSLESATAKAAWLDEAGQKKFKYDSWQAVLRRLAIHQGRAIITTTPYTLGWLKNEIHDKAPTDPEIELINFDSKENPSFPKEEYDRQQELLPRWLFNMFYKGIFERPAGMIFDCFTENHKVERFTIPDHWHRTAGIDFGGVNTAMVFLAQDPDTDIYYLYKSYKQGGLTAKQHVEKINEPGLKQVYGGSASEDQWRKEFNVAGLHVHRPPISDVELGINRVYSMFSQDKLFIFDDLDDVIDEVESYSRELDDDSQPTEKIEDKHSYHFCDALRYICSRNKRKVKVNQR